MLRVLPVFVLAACSSEPRWAHDRLVLTFEQGELTRADQVWNLYPQRWGRSQRPGALDCQTVVDLQPLPDTPCVDCEVAWSTASTWRYGTCTVDRATFYATRRIAIDADTVWIDVGSGWQDYAQRPASLEGEVEIPSDYAWSLPETTVSPL